MAIENKLTLKSYFLKGQLPKEENYASLIDSMLNKVDDGISKSKEDGLVLSPVGGSTKLMSFFKNVDDKSAIWNMAIHKQNGDLCFQNFKNEKILTFTTDGMIGIGTSSPVSTLEVSGSFSCGTRIGNLHQGKIPGDGKWYPIVKGLSGCHLFELVAGIGKKKAGRYALIHAIAISTFGKSNTKIQVKQAYYGSRSNKIEVRWTGTTFNYALELRTKSNYEDNTLVSYHISSLWKDSFMDF